MRASVLIVIAMSVATASQQTVLAGESACSTSGAPEPITPGTDTAFGVILQTNEVRSWVVKAQYNDVLAFEATLPVNARADLFFVDPAGASVALRHAFGGTLGASMVPVDTDGSWRFCIRSIEGSDSTFSVRISHSPAEPLDVRDAGRPVVAVIDTGLARDHPAFSAARLVAWKDLVAGFPHAYDDSGHGTAVAGLSLLRVSQANLVVAKAFDSNGASDWSKVTEAVSWVVDQGADIIVLSIEDHALLGQFNAEEAGFFEALRFADEQGVSVIVANGNAGPSAGSVHPPSSSPHAIAVGASDADGGPADFSELAPELIAPGVSVCAPRAKGTLLAASPSPCDGLDVGAVTGTSFSAPQVAGLLALARAIAPNATRAQTEQWVLASAVDTAEPYASEGFGRLDETSVERVVGIASTRSRLLVA